jgi:succinate-acetate transporter protein
MFNQVQGLFFLCWTIISAILVVGSLRANTAFLATLVLMLLAFFFLTIGALASGNAVLLHIGGWLAILCALVAWYTALVSLVSTAHTLEDTKFPLGRMAHGETMA